MSQMKVEKVLLRWTPTGIEMTLSGSIDGDPKQAVSQNAVLSEVEVTADTFA